MIFDSERLSTVQYSHNKQSGVVQDLGFDTTDLRDAFTEARRREDEKDFHDEMSGRDTYKIARYLSAEQREDRKEHRSSQARRADGMSRLQSLLASNAAYAKLYNGTFENLRGAEIGADAALAELEAAHAKAQQELRDMDERAAKLPDGRRAFKNENGDVVDEHGGRVSDTDAASIHWRSDEPTYEDFTAQQKYVEDLSRSIDTIRGIQVDLGEVREELSDKDNPPKHERVTELGDKIESLNRQTQETLAPIRKDQAKPADVQFSGAHMMPLPPG